MGVLMAHDMTQKAVWDQLHGAGGKKLCNTFTEKFYAIFPSGHQTSIRPYARALLNYIRAGKQNVLLAEMKSFHPDALELIVTYGTDYVPFKWSAVPPEPRHRNCAENAWEVARMSTEFPIYVEGIVFGSTALPTLHAWNIACLPCLKAMDWTLYAESHWCRYLGIPFTVVEHKELRSLTPLGKRMGLLFHKEHFTAEAKTRLTKILEQRKQRKENRSAT